MSETLLNEALAQASWAAPYVGALLVLLLWRRERARAFVAVGALLAAAVSSTLTLQSLLGSHEGYLHASYPWLPALGVTLGVYVDTLSGFMAFIVSWLSFLIGFYSLKYLEGERGLARYWFFFDFFVGSMLLLVLSDNLLTMFLGWEGTGLASYALIGFWYTDEEERWVGEPGRKALGIPMFFTPSHSSVRAIVFTRLGDVGLLTGIGLLYMTTGSLSIPVIAERAAEWATDLNLRGILFPFLVLFSLGAMAKSAQFPFHEWLVTAMTGPTSVSALIHAATMVKAGVYFMLRFTPIMYVASEASAAVNPSFHSFFVLIASIGAFTAFFMASQGLVARELKLVLAFSTASQLGYMFLGVGAAALIHEFAYGLLAAFTHLMSHAVFKAALFLAAGGVIHAVESRFMEEMGGLKRYMPLTFLATLLAALSLSGVPPFMGFWTKDTVLEVAYEAGLTVPYLLGVVTAAMTGFYSMRLLALTFLSRESYHVHQVAEEHGVHEAHRVMLLPYLGLALVTTLIGALWPVVAPTLLEALGGHVLALEEPPHISAVTLNPLLTSVSLAMVALGLAAAYLTYMRPRTYSTLGTPWPVGSRWLTRLGGLAYDRWYLNSVYYQVFVRGGSGAARFLSRRFDSLIVDGLYHRLIPALAQGASALVSKRFEGLIVDGFYHRFLVAVVGGSSRALLRGFETLVIDRGYNTGILRGALGLGNALRRLQTGRVNSYLLLLFLGALLLTIVFTLAVWP